MCTWVYSPTANGIPRPIQGRVDWQPGDEILVAGTGNSDSDTEHAIVAGTRAVATADGSVDTEVVVTRALRSDHLGVTEVHNGHVLELRAEVGVLNRANIIVRGVDVDHWDFRFIAMREHHAMLKPRRIGKIHPQSARLLK